MSARVAGTTFRPTPTYTTLRDLTRVDPAQTNGRKTQGAPGSVNR
jgi:hypothetical protein